MSYGHKPKKVAYVVIRGRVPGLYESWDQAKPQVEGYVNACFRGYFTYEAAVEVWEAWEERGDNLIQKSALTRSGKTTRKGKLESRDRLPGIEAYARDLVRRFSKNGKGEHLTTIQ